MKAINLIKRILWTTMAFSSYTAFGQDDCLLYAKHGVFDITTTNFSSDRAVSYLSLFKRDTQMTYEQASEYTAALGIPIGEFLVEIGGSASQESYKKFVDKIQSSTSFDVRDIQSVITVNKKVNVDLLEAIKDCNNKNGIHAYLVATNDPDLYQLNVKYTYSTNAPDVNLELKWTANENDLTIDGKHYKGVFPFTIKMGDKKSFGIKRFNNAAMILSLNQNFKWTPSSTGSGWPKSQTPVGMPGGGSFVIYSIKQTKRITPPPPEIKDEVILGNKISLITARVTAHVRGDQELKGPDGTQLNSGKFILSNDDKIVTGYLEATIHEPKGNKTTFIITGSYPIYQAPEGYRILGVSVQDNSGKVSEFSDIQRGFGGQEKFCGAGPLNKIFWDGDTGSDQDHITGCMVTPFLKDITVHLIKVS